MTKEKITARDLEQGSGTAEMLLELRSVFEKLSESVFEGIPGVVRIEGNRPGPTVGITVCTHGNEPAGLAAAKYLLDEVAHNRQRVSGTIFIVLNNIEATGSYFNAQSADEARHARFVDMNMNRLPDSLEITEDTEAYEVQRARKLQKIYRQFDIGFDIHSTSQDSEPMLISLGAEFPAKLVRGMPIRKVISNIDAVQIGKPVSYYYGKGKPAAQRFAIEAGTHEKTETFERSVLCVQFLLQNAGVLPEASNVADSEYEEYKVTSSVVFPNTTYELTKLFKDFESVPKGTVLAKGDGPDIVAKDDCCALFASKTKPDSLQEEVMFLTKPVQIH